MGEPERFYGLSGALLRGYVFIPKDGYTIDLSMSPNTPLRGNINTVSAYNNLDEKCKKFYTEIISDLGRDFLVLFPFEYKF